MTSLPSDDFVDPDGCVYDELTVSREWLEFARQELAQAFLRGYIEAFAEKDE